MPKGYKHLTYSQRCQISKFLSIGLTQKYIAKYLNVSQSTISREIKRNTGEDGYIDWKASCLYKFRRTKISSIPKKMTPKLISQIKKFLSNQWSPEQISGRLKQKGVSISYEAIYLYIWKDKRNGGDLYNNLRRFTKKKYTKRSNIHKTRIPNRPDIKDRPEVVEHKSRVGDWEGDTIIGKGRKGFLLSYVDRKSKFTILEKISRKTSKDVVDATVKRFCRIKNKAHTVTFDNGKEFCGHNQITKKIGVSCFFATPYSAWERGLNEHTNGLVRQYIPKSKDISVVTKEEIKDIENLLNNRPRKVLGYRTPREVFLEAG